ncbi:hypothetical protein GAY31_20045 [Azospirillum brasilense]|nr:hypothetical protein [Azospirillum brasilense]
MGQIRTSDHYKQWSFTVSAPFGTEPLNWCIENCVGEFAQHNHFKFSPYLSMQPQYYFTDADDAIRFKLIYGGQ